MGIGLLGVAGLACLLAGWNAGGSQVSSLSASEVIALRFPDSRYDAWDDVAALPATQAEPDDSYSLFDPNPTMPPAATTVATIAINKDGTAAGFAATSNAAQSSSPSAQAQQVQETAKATMKLASVTSKPAPPPAPKARPGAVLNDAQIASIKSRLRLTRDQQDMWPAVEAALRGLSFEKKADGTRKIAYTGSIDPYSDEAQRLKSAAFPLIMSFSDEQKSELRVIAHVAGLEKLASQF
jgi:hypothetical protein